jgi:hypothetical protein
MGSVPSFRAGGPTAADLETAPMVCRSAVMANGAKKLPRRLHETDAAQRLVAWIIGKKNWGSCGTRLSTANLPELEEVS